MRRRRRRKVDVFVRETLNQFAGMGDGR